LGLWLALDGVWARVFAAYLFPANALSLWKGILAGFGLGPQQMAWPLVVLGASWAGALIGLSLGRRWARTACTILAAAAVPLLGLPTLLAGWALAGLGTLDRRGATGPERSTRGLAARRLRR
jgi:hypothetical protein